MIIEICVGSTCHVYGSYDILTFMRKRLNELGLTDRVQFKSAFCMGNCPEAVCIRVNGERISGVNQDNVEEIFNKHVLKQLNDNFYEGV